MPQLKGNLTPLLGTLVFLIVLLGLATRGAYGMTGYDLLIHCENGNNPMFAGQLSEHAHCVAFLDGVWERCCINFCDDRHPRFLYNLRY